MKGSDFEVDCFKIHDIFTNFNNLHLQSTDTDEHLEIINYNEIFKHRYECISNLPWLIGMCFDKQFPLTTYNIIFKDEKCTTMIN
jgi:hypothetical protein